MMNEQQVLCERKLCEGIDQLTAEVALGAVHVHARIGDLAERLGELRTTARAGGWPQVAEQAEGLAARLEPLVSGDRDWAQVERELRLSLALLKEMVEEHPPEAAPLADEALAGGALADAAMPAVDWAGLLQDGELVGDFLLESREHLANVESQVLVLERRPEDADAMNAVFRGFHTIKGLAGFLGFSAIRDLTHEVETALDRCRSGRLELSQAVINVVLESADYLGGALEVIERALHGQQHEAFLPNQPLIERVKAVLAGQPVASRPAPREEAPAGTMVTATAGTRVAAPVAVAVADEKEVPGAVNVPPAAAAGEPARKAETAATDKRAQAVKVDTHKLDHLVDMVGELVIAQSMVRHEPSLAESTSPGLTRNLALLGRITDELQKTAMSMRLVKLEGLFQKMTRLVRDTAMKTGKNVELVTAGEETELDRNIVEDLADPLLHMIRNAVDHGIEMPEARAAAGKTAKARVSLRASYQAGYIQIEIADDGRGLDRDRILAKAVERGLVDSAARLTDSEVFNLIFAPGFSTAEKVTDLSGRGVGMDVVRKQIQKMRGRIDIESVIGRGTTFVLKLPLTLAIIDGLVVAVGGERYIIPIFAVKEMLRPEPEALTTVEGKAEMAVVRGRLLPIVRLHECFGIEPKYRNPAEALLIVSECEGKPFALMVDELTGKQEVVLKSLGELMKNVRGLTGCAILGDGRVGLILDVEALFRG